MPVMIETGHEGLILLPVGTQVTAYSRAVPSYLSGPVPGSQSDDKIDEGEPHYTT